MRDGEDALETFGGVGGELANLFPLSRSQGHAIENLQFFNLGVVERNRQVRAVEMPMFIFG